LEHEALNPESCGPACAKVPEGELGNVREGVWVQAPPPVSAPRSCCGPTEEELTRAALEDPAGLDTGPEDEAPTVWRVMTLIAFAVAALAIVFGHRW
jgi:hypothetical protein